MTPGGPSTTSKGPRPTMDTHMTDSIKYSLKIIVGCNWAVFLIKLVVARYLLQFFGLFLTQVWSFEQQLFALPEVPLVARLFLCFYTGFLVLGGTAYLFSRLASHEEEIETEARSKRQRSYSSTSTYDSTAWPRHPSMRRANVPRQSPGQPFVPRRDAADTPFRGKASPRGSVSPRGSGSVDRDGSVYRDVISVHNLSIHDSQHHDEAW